MKFKIGDKVRLSKNVERLEKGATGTVTDITHTTWPVSVRLDCCVPWDMLYFSEDELEIVSPLAEFSTADLLVEVARRIEEK